MVVDVVEFGAVAIGDLAGCANFRAGADYEAKLVAVDGERGDGRAGAGDHVILVPAGRPWLARVERLVGDDGLDFLYAVEQDRVGEIGEAVALAIVGVDQRRVAGADEEEAGRGAIGGDEADGGAEGGVGRRHVAEGVEGGGDGEDFRVGGWEEAVVGVDGDEFAAVERRDDEAPVNALHAGRFQAGGGAVR